MLKQCYKCGKIKPFDDFHKDKTLRDGHSNKCKDCANKASREWYIKNRGDALSRAQEYRATHKKEIKAYRQQPGVMERARTAKRSEHYKEVRRARRRERMKDAKFRATLKAYRRTEKYKKQHSEYKKRPEVKKKTEQRRKSRMATDPIFAIKARARNLVKESIRRTGYKKNDKAHKILGCSFDTLWGHLLSTWKYNYGESWKGEPYHIDHIVPLATARTEEDVIKLCHYTNLQMLTPEDNLKKGAKETLPAVD